MLSLILNATISLINSFFPVLLRWILEPYGILYLSDFGTNWFLKSHQTWEKKRPLWWC